MYKHNATILILSLCLFIQTALCREYKSQFNQTLAATVPYEYVPWLLVQSCKNLTFKDYSFQGIFINDSDDISFVNCLFNGSLGAFSLNSSSASIISSISSAEQNGIYWIAVYAIHRESSLTVKNLTFDGLWSGLITASNDSRSNNNYNITFDGITINGTFYDVVFDAHHNGNIKISNMVYMGSTVRLFNLFDSSTAKLECSTLITNVTYPNPGSGFSVSNTLSAYLFPGSGNKVWSPNFFRNYSRKDYHLINGSSANGSSAYDSSSCSKDRDGISRPFGSYYSIGAYQYIPDIIPTTVVPSSPPVILPTLSYPPTSGSQAPILFNLPTTGSQAPTSQNLNPTISPSPKPITFPSSFYCTPPQPLGSVCTFDGWYIENILNDSNFTITNSLTIKNFVQSSNATLIFYPNAVLNIEGCSNFYGYIAILSDNIKDQLNVTIRYNDSCHAGNFSDYNIVGRPSGDCEYYKTEVSDDYSGVLIIFVSSESRNCHWWIILVCVVGGVLLLGIIFVIVVFSSKSLNAKLLPYSKKMFVGNSNLP